MPYIRTVIRKTGTSGCHVVLSLPALVVRLACWPGHERDRGWRGDNAGPLGWLITPVCGDQGIMTLITRHNGHYGHTDTGHCGGVHQPLCQDNASYATRDSSSEWLSSIFTVHRSSQVLTNDNFTYSGGGDSTFYNRFGNKRSYHA